MRGRGHAINRPFPTIYDAIHSDALPDGLPDGLFLHVATDFGDRLRIFEVGATEETVNPFIADHFSTVAEQHDLQPLEPAFEGPPDVVLKCPDSPTDVSTGEYGAVYGP